jgi:tRNA threonylcarbamoyladenosine biosynthesis protein TsaB
MTVLGIDTATAATAAAAWAEDVAIERRDDPGPGARPAHAARLLELIEAVLTEAGGWETVTRIAVGLGPGGFTGLRHGIATARALAQARALPLAGVSSLRALAAGAQGAPDGRDEAAAAPGGAAEAGATLAVIDARRGEVFAAAYRGEGELLVPLAIAPAALAGRLGGPLAAPLAVGDGAVRFRDELERAGAVVPADSSSLHRVSALQVCRLGAVSEIADRDALIPDYRREPDASPPRPPRS